MREWETEIRIMRERQTEGEQENETVAEWKRDNDRLR